MGTHEMHFGILIFDTVCGRAEKQREREKIKTKVLKKMFFFNAFLAVNSQQRDTFLRGDSFLAPKGKWGRSIFLFAFKKGIRLNS